MALFGSAGGGLFGLGGSNQTRFQPIIGIGSGLLQASISADLAQSALRGLPQSERDRLNFRDDEAAIVPPWLEEQRAEALGEDTGPENLATQVREIGLLDSFFDGTENFAETAEGDADSQATFELYRALDRLKTIAEFASQDSTSEASLGRLNDLFQEGLNEVRSYVGETQLDKLELFLGERSSRTETEVRLGRNATKYNAGLISNSADDILQGVSASDAFSLTLNKKDIQGNITRTDTFNVDLSQIVGDITLNSVSELINNQITSLQATNEDGSLRFDDDGNPVSLYQTRFDVERDFDEKKFRFSVNSSLLEDVNLEAANYTPSLFVASGVTPTGTDQTTVARVSEVENLDGEMSVSTLQSFAGIDLEATEFAELTEGSEPEDDGGIELTPEQQALRDQFRTDARESVLSESELEAFNDEQTAEAQAGRSITDIDDELRVNANTFASQVATDSQGNVFVVGSTEGSFGHQVNNASESDVFLTKFDSVGNVIFSRLLGSNDESEGFAITVDDQDNVIIAGQTNSALAGRDFLDTKDAFVAKFDNNGNEKLRYQLDTFGTTAGLALTTTASTVDGDGNVVDGDIILGGSSSGSISSTSGFGGTTDGLLLRIDGEAGTLKASQLIGGAGRESIEDIAIAADGNLLLASEEDGAAVLRKVDINDFSSNIFTENLGYLGSGGSVEGLAVDGNHVYVAGVTVGQSVAGGGAIVGGFPGGRDGYVTRITDNGATANADYSRNLGTVGADKISDITASNGKVYVAGTTTSVFSGEENVGGRDGFVARIDGATSVVEDTQQFGQYVSNTVVGGVAFTNRGSSVLDKLGLPSGEVNADQERTIQTQTSARVGDYFDIRVTDNGRSRKFRIDLEEGDTFKDLERAIRVRAFKGIEVSTKRTSEGESLKIEALKDIDAAEIELIPGEGDRDLLSRIGLEPGRLIPSDKIFGIDDEDDDLSEEDRREATLGGSFALGLDGPLNLETRGAARYVLGQVEDAISSVQRAFRSLTYNPFRDSDSGPGNRDGTVSQRTQNQIANFTTALQRLQSNQQTSPALSLFI